MEQTKRTNPADSPCEHCGSFEAVEFAGKILCDDCIQLAGCGCAGHGDDAN